MTTDNIESILQENRLFSPDDSFVSKATAKKADLDALREKANQDHEGFWADLARSEMDWKTPFNKILDSSEAPHFRWFYDGTLNVSYNCLDRHLDKLGNKTAIVFEGEKGDTQHLTFSELHGRVCQFANGLKSIGIEKGDRVVIYMPMVPEAAIAMLACARIGAIHSVVFGGFSAESLKDRIEDAGAVCVITADGGTRGGKIVELKTATDKALSHGCETINKVVVLKRTGHDIEFNADRDIWWDALTEGQSSECEPEWVDSEHPLFLLYTCRIPVKFHCYHEMGI